MVDKMAEMGIMISAKLLSKYAGIRRTLAHSHSLLNSIKLLGLSIARYITGLLSGFASTENRRYSVAGNFYIKPNGTTPGAANTQGRNITRLQRSPMMRRDSTNSSAGSQNTGSSFNPQLSALLDLLIQHEETLRAELVKTKQIRQQIEEMIPNNPLKDFINTLGE